MAKLGDVTIQFSGTGFPKKYQGKSVGMYPFYKVSDISKNVLLSNRYLEKCENYVDEEVVKEIKGTIVPKNTVVFAKIGEAVKLNRRSITIQDCLVDNNVMGIFPKTDFLDVKYLYYFMLNIRLENYAEATTVPSVKKSVIEKIEIPLPSLEKQYEVVRVLDMIDNLLIRTRGQIEDFDLLIKSRYCKRMSEEVAA